MFHTYWLIWKTTKMCAFSGDTSITIPYVCIQSLWCPWDNTSMQVTKNKVFIVGVFIVTVLLKVEILLFFPLEWVKFILQNKNEWLHFTVAQTKIEVFICLTTIPLILKTIYFCKQLFILMKWQQFLLGLSVYWISRIF